MATGLIDFHNHFVGRLTSEAAAKWPALADEQALERSLEAVSVRVVSTPLEFALRGAIELLGARRVVAGNASELLGFPG